MRPVLLALFLTACSGGAPSRDSTLEVSPDDSQFFHCFRLEPTDGAGSLLACAAESDTCERMRRLALKHGGYAKIGSIGECSWLEVAVP